MDFGAALRGDAQQTPPPALLEQDDQQRQDQPRAEIVVVNPFNLDRVRGALAVFDPEIDAMVEKAKGVVIQDEASQVLAVEMAGQAKKLNAEIEKARKEFVAKPNEYVKAVNAMAKNFQARLSQIEDGLKRKISEYALRLELERRKAEEASRKAQAELQAKLDSEAKAAGVEPVQVEAPVIPKAEAPVRTASGTAYQRKEWVFVVEDPKLVPREYLCVDERSIREAVRAGVRAIPGVKISEETKTALRM